MARMALIPGFRFHPTDVELVMFYLKRKLLGKKITVNVVAEVNIYDFSPWDLPDKSDLKSRDLEWYFFCPKAKKYSSGDRCNRATEAGFWKATGKDRTVKYNGRTVATIKTLVFHIGHKGKGERTDWVMHEYQMEDEQLANSGIVQDMYVLCKVFQKSGPGPKNGAQYGAPFNEEEWGDDLAGCGPVGASNTMDVEQEGPATTTVTEHGSAVVTVSTNTPAANTTENGSASGVFSANTSESTLSLVAPQNTHAMPVTEPLSSSGPLSSELLAIDDFMLYEDFDLLMASDDKAAANVEKANTAPNEDNFFEDLVNLIDLGNLNEIDFKTDAADYTLDGLLALDGLEEFYVE